MVEFFVSSNKQGHRSRPTDVPECQFVLLPPLVLALRCALCREYRETSYYFHRSTQGLPILSANDPQRRQESKYFAITGQEQQPIASSSSFVHVAINGIM